MKIDRGDDASHFQLVIRTGSAEKLCILNSIIRSLKQDCSEDNSDYLVIAPAGKEALNIYESIIHSHSDRLNLLARGKLNDLKGN